MVISNGGQHPKPTASPRVTHRDAAHDTATRPRYPDHLAHPRERSSRCWAAYPERAAEPGRPTPIKVVSAVVELALTAQYVHERIGGLELNRLLPARAE